MKSYANTIANRRLNSFKRRVELLEAETQRVQDEAKKLELLRAEAGFLPRTGWNASPTLPLDEALKMEVKPCKCYVYKLEVGGLSYVGFTTLEPSERVRFHIEDAKNGSQLAIHAKLRQFGYLFDLEVLASEENEILGLVREISFIEKIAPDLNATKGGEGNDFELFFQRNDVNETVLFVRNKVAAEQNKEEDDAVEEFRKKKLSDENKWRVDFHNRQKQEKLDAEKKKAQREKALMEKLLKLKETDFNAYLNEQQKRADLFNLKGGKFKKENHKWVVGSDGELVHQYQKPKSSFFKKLFS